MIRRPWRSPLLRTLLRMLLLAASMIIPCQARSQTTAELVTLPVRPGITETYLLVADKDAPVGQVVVLFSGGNGLVRLRPFSLKPEYAERGNYLVRTRYLWTGGGFAAAVVDVPSDLANSGLDDGFRLGRTHAEDIAKVIADLRQRFPKAQVTLIGTSRGTVSAASVARHLPGGFDRVVLTSTLFNASRAGPGLAGFDYASIKGPLLFVHHADDSCTVTPYSGARRQGSTYALITVRGGKPPESGECDPLAPHGYFGREAESVEAIKNWIRGSAWPKEIN